MTLEPGHSRREGEEQAALYALGALDAAETASFEAHLDEGCAQCRADVRTMQWTASQLAVASATTPPPALRDRLLASRDTPIGPDASRPKARGPVQTDPTIAEAAYGGHSTIRADATPWEESGFPGIMIRRLHLDPAQGRQTILVRMAAGASYFPHRHDAAEESFVLEGDVTADGETLTAGDYHRAAAGSLHGAQTTESGCLLLIISSTHDNFVVDTPQP